MFPSVKQTIKKTYGTDKKTCDWFFSIMADRTQRVSVGNAISKPIKLQSGVPQGGILSPIIFTTYGADISKMQVTRIQYEERPSRGSYHPVGGH